MNNYNIGYGDQGDVYATAWPVHVCGNRRCGNIIQFHNPTELLFFVSDDNQWWCGHHIEMGLTHQKQLDKGAQS